MLLSVRRHGKSEAERIEYEIQVRRDGERLVRVQTVSPGAQRLIDEARSAFAKGFEWDRPTSVAAFRKWRNRVQVVEERVEKRSAVEVALIVLTSPALEGVSRAELVVEESSGRARETAIGVGDFEYKVREISVETLTEPGIADGSPVAPSESSHGPLLQPADLESLEMAVRHSLHHLGADLGEPIEVYRDRNERVTVEALGLPPARIANLRQLTESFPGVRLVTQPESRQEACVDCGITRLESMTISGERKRDPVWVSHLVTEAAYERFSSEALRRVEGMLNRAYALDRLARAYPPDRESLLAPGAKEQLQEMLRVHRSSVRAELDQLVASLPFRVNQVGEVQVSASWQQATSALLKAAKEADQALKVSLGLLAGNGMEPKVSPVLEAVS